MQAVSSRGLQRQCLVILVTVPSQMNAVSNRKPSFVSLRAPPLHWRAHPCRLPVFVETDRHQPTYRGSTFCRTSERILRLSVCMVRRMGLAGLPFTRTDVRHCSCSRSGVTAPALPDEPFFWKNFPTTVLPSPTLDHLGSSQDEDCA